MLLVNKHSLTMAVQSTCAARPEVRLAYLYGSQVEGSAGPGSDIDVGLLLADAGDDELTLAEVTHTLTLALPGEKLDVIPLHRAPIELAYKVIAQGECLYQCDNATRVEFEATVLTRYGDYLPVLRAMRADILQGDEDGRRVQRYREALRRTERTLGEIKGTQR